VAPECGEPGGSTGATVDAISDADAEVVGLVPTSVRETRMTNEDLAAPSAEVEWQLLRLDALVDELRCSVLHRAARVAQQRLAVCVALQTLELADLHGVLLASSVTPRDAAGQALRDLWILSRWFVVSDSLDREEMLPGLAALVDICRMTMLATDVRRGPRPGAHLAVR
jgi:hypothetical protein